MKIRNNVIMLLLGLYFSHPVWAYLPVSLSNTLWVGDNIPSLTLRVKDIETQQIQPLYFVLYPNNTQTLAFMGNQYEVLSSQFQYRETTINNFCGLEGRQVNKKELQIELQGAIDPANVKNPWFACQLKLDRFALN